MYSIITVAHFVIRIRSTATKTIAATLAALERITASGPALAPCCSFAGIELLRPAKTVNAAATPPIVTVEIAEVDHESRNGPKITSELITIQPAATASSQPVVRPHHSWSGSSVHRLEIPAKIMIAKKNNAMKSGMPKQVYNSIFAIGCGNKHSAPNQRSTPPIAPEIMTARNSKNRNPCAGRSDPTHENK